MPTVDLGRGRRRQFEFRIPNATDALRAEVLSNIVEEREVAESFYVSYSGRALLPGNAWSHRHRRLHISHPSREDLIAAIDEHLGNLQRPVFVLGEGIHLRNDRAALTVRIDAELSRMGVTDQPTRERWVQTVLEPARWSARNAELHLRLSAATAREAEVASHASQATWLQVMPWLIAHIRKEQL